MTNLINAFISSTSKDLEDYRVKAIKFLRKLGVNCIAMEEFTATERNALQLCYDELSSAQLFVGIYAYRYGYAPDDTVTYKNESGNVIAGDGETSITNWEYQWAKDRGLPLFLFVVSPDSTNTKKQKLLLKHIEPDPQKSRLEAFKKQIIHDHVVGFFSTPDELTNEILAAVGKHLSFKGTLSKRCDFYKHIAPPEKYVLRNQLLDELRLELLSDTASSSATTKYTPIVFHGMGGLGKSAIARALCDDPAIQTAFPDGILWTTLGTDPNLVTKLREWVTALHGTINESSPTLDSLKANLANLLQDRACLLIVDDVWHQQHAELFHCEGTKCRLLVTTRDAGIAPSIGAEIKSIPALEEEEAIELLDRWSSMRISTTDGELKRRIVNQLSSLPLAIKLAGARLGEISPQEWFNEFERLRDLDAEFDTKSPEQSVSISFNLSVDALKPLVKKLYLSLGIFSEDTAIPLNAITKLWTAIEPLRPQEINRITEDLTKKALLEFERISKTVTIHDLLRQFIQDETEDQKLDFHLALLNSYRKTQLGTGWDTAPDDGYLYDHIVYHLANANQYEELRNLILSNEWHKARVKQSKYLYDGYALDLDTTWDIAHKKALQETDERYFLDCVSYALLRTKLNELSANYIPELVARALVLNLPNWDINRVLSIISRVSNLEDRAHFYVTILNTDSLENKVIDFCIESALNTIEEFYTQRGLSAFVRRGIPQSTYNDLARHCQNNIERFTRLLNALLLEDRDEDIASYIGAMGGLIPVELLDWVIDIVLDMELDIHMGIDPSDALEGIIDRLDEKQIDKLLSHKGFNQVTRESVESLINDRFENQSIIYDETILVSSEEIETFVNGFDLGNGIGLYNPQITQLRGLQGKFTPTQVSTLVHKAIRFEDHSFPSPERAEVLKILSPYINSELQIEIFNEIIDLTFGDTEFCSVLSALLNELDPDVIVSVYEIILSKLNYEQVDAITILAPKLDKQLTDRALQDFPTSTISSNLIESLSQLLPFIPSDNQLEETDKLLSYIRDLGEDNSLAENCLEELAKQPIKKPEFAFLMLLRLMQGNYSILTRIKVIRDIFHLLLLHDVSLTKAAFNLLEIYRPNKLKTIQDIFFYLVSGTLQYRITSERTDLSENEKQTRLIEIEKTQIKGLEIIAEENELELFFAAFSIMNETFDEKKIETAISLIANAGLDYSNTEDLTFLTPLLRRISNRPDLLEIILNQLIHIRQGNNTNLPLILALLPSIAAYPNLLHKALHYAYSLSIDYRLTLSMNLAQYLTDEDFGSLIIETCIREIISLINDVEHNSEFSVFSRLLESFGEAICDSEAAIKMYLEVVAKLLKPFDHAQALAAIGRSRYFTDKLHHQLLSDVLEALREYKMNNTFYIWRTISYPSFLKQLQLSSLTVKKICDFMILVDREWDWL